MLEDKRISVKYGRMSYYKINSLHTFCILFIPNIGSTRDWVPQQSLNLPKYTWLFPDLIGFGSSTRVDIEDAFLIDQYAQDLYLLLKEENIQELLIVGNGIGGLIGLSLLSLFDTTINLHGLVELHTPHILSDVVDDIGRKSFEEYKNDYQKDIERYTRLNTPVSKLIVQHLRKLNPYSIWASYKNLDEKLKGNIYELITNSEIPIFYFISTNLRGSLKTEKFMKATKHVVMYVDDAQQNMHLENPTELWKLITEILESVNPK